MSPKKAVILVGHGGIPSDCPPELVARFKQLERESRGKPTPELSAADSKLRNWPRDAQSDPYRPGLEAVADALRGQLKDHLVFEAYNEFCAPSLEQAMHRAVAGGARQITVITTMFTRGGVHSEMEVPVLLEALRRRYPGVEIRYVWPFDIQAVAEMLSGEIRRVEGTGTAVPNLPANAN